MEKYVRRKVINMKFSIMWKNEKVADIETWEGKSEVKIERYSMEFGKQPFIGGVIDRKRIYDFF